MKLLKSGLSLALLGAGLAVVAGTSSSAAGGTAPQVAAESPAVRAMRDAAHGDVRVTTESATGKVGFIAARGAQADLYPDVAGDTTAKAAAKADAYLAKFGASFGAAAGQLVKARVDPGAWGTTITYVQEYRGVPVYGSTLKANVDPDGDLVSVTGYAAPGLDLSVKPRVTAAKAAERAVGVVKADPPTTETGGKADVSGVKAVAPQLVVYRTGALRGVAGETLLAYQVQVTNKTTVRDMVILDANTNKPVNRYSMMTDATFATNRRLYETTPDSTPVYTEGDALPGTLNQDQQNLVASAGDSYWLYADTFGRDSYDGLGAVMKTVNNDPRINCPNANWNGTTTNYCDGVTSDDVVSHEWGHAYTEYTSGLIYQYQSGALNESYSDVWGETIDQINGREDEGETFGTKRPDGDCDPTAPAKLNVTITAPAAQAGACTAAFGFGPAYTTTTETHQVVVATDPADTAGPSTTDGCEAYTNAAAVVGNYAYVDRGTCTFQVKANNAVAAGATGIVVGQSVAGLPTVMSGSSTIPGTMISKADGARVKAAGTVTMTFQADDISARTDSTRWLIGEKSEAFGGAIRDMWTPTCYGNPGKVTDAEYNCDPNNLDSGGVHGNSGVTNHAYALVVDGGTYNGQTISGIGLDKAANIWWHTQTSYLTPISDFTSAADDFEQSCLDLVGKPINALSVTPNTPSVPTTPIVSDDCTQVAHVMTAVEMRANPVQCNFQPQLDKATPSLCGAGFNEYAVYSEDFEDGLDGWTPSFDLYDDGDYAGGIHDPWTASTAAPGDHPGGVAYGPVPDKGDCSGDGVNDFSSADYITSGDITIPAGDYAPVMSFDQYIATESGFDGGNVQISVGGGDFAPIPAAAYTFNAPKTLTTAGGGSSDPLAGQPGFTGTDGGKIEGSWGTSQIDLGAIDVAPGDTVKLRLAVGRDGCGGIDPEFGGGWAVDNIKITTCRVASSAAATAPATVFGKGGTVTVTLSAADATGTVRLTGVGSALTAPVGDDGTAVFTMPTGLQARTYTGVATYSGDIANDGTTTQVTYLVRRATTATKVTSKTATVKKGKSATVKVKVTSPYTVPGGYVGLYQGNNLFGKTKVVDGVATIKTKALGRVGNLTFAVKFTPGPNFGTSSTKVGIKVTKP